jgi:hypothetical protein
MRVSPSPALWRGALRAGAARQDGWRRCGWRSGQRNAKCYRRLPGGQGQREGLACAEVDFPAGQGLEGVRLGEQCVAAASERGQRVRPEWNGELDLVADQRRYDEAAGGPQVGLADEYQRDRVALAEAELTDRAGQSGVEGQRVGSRRRRTPYFGQVQRPSGGVERPRRRSGPVEDQVPAVVEALPRPCDDRSGRPEEKYRPPTG